MPVTHSPLRYPGGKSSIYNMIDNLLVSNNLCGSHYYEPYAGGCGLALALLIKGRVSHIHINDLDRSIWSFWDAVLHSTEELISKIESTEITISEWYEQRIVQENKEHSLPIELAFSTLFMNRTNRSGIILKAGVIGGFEQKGKYKLDCRFNKKDIIRKIRVIANLRDRITLYNMDAQCFFDTIGGNNSSRGLVLIDPPYYEKGSTLYTNFYNKDQHVELCKKITSLNLPWITTYDNADEIRRLYKDHRVHEFKLNYSAATKRVGTEIIIFSHDIKFSSDFHNNYLCV